MNPFKKKEKEQILYINEPKPLFSSSNSVFTAKESYEKCICGEKQAERKIYKVDVSNIPAKDLKGYMQGVIDTIKMFDGEQKNVIIRDN